MSIIKLENISYSYYGKIPALTGIDLEINEGEMCAVIGANGSGKSTLLQIINGLIYPDSGTVYFEDKIITENSLREKNFLRYFRGNTGFVFQNSEVQLFCQTVLDELLFGPMQLGLDKEEAMARSEQILNMLNIAYLRDRPSHMLSGGEKKRVAIASVLTMNPRVLLLDEPASGLDPKTQCFLIELIIGLSEAGKTIIMATHDLALVDDLKPRIAVLSEEHRMEASGGDEILKDTMLLRNVNLIHEHLHRYADGTHRHIHTHYFSHEH